MKIIISSLYLQRQIQKVIIRDISKITISNDYIIFYNSSEKEILQIELHPICKTEKEFSAKFDKNQWLQIYNFLKLIPEQPIVMEISDCHEDLSFTLSQMCAKF